MSNVPHSSNYSASTASLNETAEQKSARVRREDGRLHGLIATSKTADHWAETCRELTKAYKANGLRPGVARRFMAECTDKNALACFKLNTGRMMPLDKPKVAASPLKGSRVVDAAVLQMVRAASEAKKAERRQRDAAFRNAHRGDASQSKKAG